MAMLNPAIPALARPLCVAALTVIATKRERTIGNVGGQGMTALGQIDHAFAIRLQHHMTHAYHQGEILIGSLAGRLSLGPALSHSLFGVGTAITVIILIGTTAIAGQANDQPKRAPAASSRRPKKE